MSCVFSHFSNWFHDALFVYDGSKYEEIIPPRVEGFCFITDNTYTRGEVCSLESKHHYELGSIFLCFVIHFSILLVPATYLSALSRYSHGCALQIMQVSQFNDWYGWEVARKSILASEHLTGWPDPNNWSYSYFLPYYDVIISFREKKNLIGGWL